MKFILNIICTIFSLEVIGQNDLLWVGPNLTEISNNNGRWFYHAEDWSARIIELDSLYYVLDESTLERRYPIAFDQLDGNLDTLILKQNRGTLFFIKPYLLTSSNFRFHAFEYTEIDPWGLIQIKYELNRFGVFRISNNKNETIVETSIPSNHLEIFLDLCQPIDIRNMDKAHGTMNFCDNIEYRFTFWDTSGGEYSYISRYIRGQLMPIKEFITQLRD